MNTFSRMIAAIALHMSGISIAAAAGDGWLTCKDGLMARSAVVCDVHGGVKIETVKSTPIDTTKVVAPAKATTSKPKTQPAKVSAAQSGTTQKKTASNSTRNPTAKCLDGAFYYSTERRGACSKHGGVDKWYGW